MLAARSPRSAVGRGGGLRRPTRGLRKRPHGARTSSGGGPPCCRSGNRALFRGRFGRVGGGRRPNPPPVAAAADGQTIYIGGAFSNVAGKTRKRLAALDVQSGDLLSWNSGTNALVRQIVAAGDQLFVAGDFTSIGGASRRGVAALDTATGLAARWGTRISGNSSAPAAPRARA